MYMYNVHTCIIQYNYINTIQYSISIQYSIQVCSIHSIIHLLMFLKSGLSTEGDTDSVLLVGPSAPTTYFGRPKVGVVRVTMVTNTNLLLC